jgi:RNA polymerase sigma-70 factor (ECF subfamily)
MEAGEITAPAVRGRGASLEEIEALYARDAARLRRVAAGITGDADAAHDVVQETFARVVGRRSTFGGGGPLEAWVWRVCVNTALNRRRADRRAVPAPPEPREAPAADEALRAAVAELPRRQKAALFLHYYADLDYAAIAAVLGIRTGTVGKLLHDARARVRRALEEEA